EIDRRPVLIERRVHAGRLIPIRLFRFSLAVVRLPESSARNFYHFDVVGLKTLIDCADAGHGGRSYGRRRCGGGSRKAHRNSKNSQGSSYQEPNIHLLTHVVLSFPNSFWYPLIC